MMPMCVNPLAPPPLKTRPTFWAQTVGMNNHIAINTKSIFLITQIKQLKTYDITPVVIDPWANESDALREYGVELKSMAEARDADCVIVAVAHNEFKAMSLSDIKGLFRKSADAEKVLLDVKGLYKIDELKASGMRWWRL